VHGSRHPLTWAYLAARRPASARERFDSRDFPRLAERREWKDLVERVNARQPKTPRATVAVTLGEPGLVAEGIAADPDGRTLYVSSIRARKILRVAVDGSVSDLVSPAGGGLLSPLGMKVDAARGLLWTAANASRAMDGWDPSMRGQSGVFAFDLRTGELRRKALVTGEKHFLNDVAIAPDGTVFVTDSTAGAVHRLEPGATELRPAIQGGFVYPNGIIIVGDHVVFAHALGLHAFPVAGGASFPVRGPPRFPLGGIDGLAIAGTTAFGVQNALGTPRIVRLEFAPAGVRVEQAHVVETANPTWRVPTTGAFARGGYVYIGNSHVDEVTDAGVGPGALVETHLLQLPVR
jgi:sugar lactone lactonase YvrE